MKYYQKPLCKDNIKWHLKVQHPKRYHKYNNLKTSEDKIKFFQEVDGAKPFAAILNPNAGMHGLKKA